MCFFFQFEAFRCQALHAQRCSRTWWHSQHLKTKPGVTAWVILCGNQFDFSYLDTHLIYKIIAYMVCIYNIL